MHLYALTTLFGLSAGVFFGETFLHGTEIAVVAFFLGVIQFTLFVFERRLIKKQKTRSFSILLMSGIFFVCIFIGVARIQLVVEKEIFVCNTVCTFQARVLVPSEVKGVYQHMVVRISDTKNESTMYDVMIRVPLYPQYVVGDELSLTGKVTVPSLRVVQPGEKTFDYVSYLRLHNIGSEMLYPSIKILTDQKKKNVKDELMLIKEKFISSIFLYVDAPSASLASGMLFGESGMSKELVETFRIAGLSHIVVLSGFNIAILITCILIVFRFVPLFLRIFFAGGIVIFFVVMVGAEVSIVRATCMSFIALLALLIGRDYRARQALIISLIGIILYQPSSLLYDVSLHLSFLATAGIVYMSESIKKNLTIISSVTYKEIIVTTLCAYVATLPYVMYTFGTISLYALFANIVVLPLVPVMMLITFLVVVTATLATFLAYGFGYVTTILGEGIIYLTEMIQILPFASLQVSLSRKGMLLLYAMLAVLFFYIARRRNNETPATNNSELVSEIISY